EDALYYNISGLFYDGLRPIFKEGEWDEEVANIDSFAKSDRKKAKFNQYNIGNFTMTKGEDEKGKYLSYYDKWDLHPMGKDKGKIYNLMETLGVSQDQSQS